MAVGIITSLAGMGMSIAQAAKARDEQRKAEYEAEKSLKEAKMLLEKNFYEGIAIPKETYEMQADILKTAGEQALTAAQEAGVRATSVAPGRVLAGLVESGAKLRGQMAGELLDLERLQAMEASRLRDKGVGIREDVATGAGLKRREAAVAEAQAITGAAEAGQILGEEIFGMIPLYGKDKMGRTLTRAERQAGSFGDFKQKIVDTFGDVEIGYEVPKLDAEGKRIGTETKQIKVSEATDRSQLMNFLRGKQLEDVEQLGGVSKVGQALKGAGDVLLSAPGAVVDFAGEIPQFFSDIFGRKQGGSDVGNFLRNIFKKNP